MLNEQDPKFLSEKLDRLTEVRTTSTSPSEKGRLDRCIKKTKRRLKEAGKRKDKEQATEVQEDKNKS